MDAKFPLHFKVKINSFAGTTKCILEVFSYKKTSHKKTSHSAPRLFLISFQNPDEGSTPHNSNFWSTEMEFLRLYSGT